MAAIERLLEEIDRLWTPDGDGKTPLRVIGSAALMLQARYERGTKDGDVLETHAVTGARRERLIALAGKGTDLHARFGFYLDVVPAGLPMLPHPSLFHPVPSLNGLKHFTVESLDAVDVVVSKLKRFNRNDDADVRAMIALGLVPHGRLIERFESAKERFTLDARAQDLPKVVKNLNRVERDYLGVAPTEIELPDWL